MDRTHGRNLALTLVAMAALCGCYLEEGPYERHHGTATLAWSIDGGREPAACAAHNATFVRLFIRYEDDGGFEDVVSCTRFASRYVLHRGWYTATLELLDAAQAPVSVPRDAGTFFVAQDREAFVTVDLTPAFDGGVR